MASIRGLAYPLQTSNGNLAISEDTGSYEDQIMSSLETRPFERVMRADYGFDPGIFDTMEPNAINARIYNAITEQVQGLSSVEVIGNITTADAGLYSAVVKYSIRGIPQPPLTISLSI